MPTQQQLRAAASRLLPLRPVLIEEHKRTTRVRYPEIEWDFDPPALVYVRGQMLERVPWDGFTEREAFVVAHRAACGEPDDEWLDGIDAA